MLLKLRNIEENDKLEAVNTSQPPHIIHWIIQQVPAQGHSGPLSGSPIGIPPGVQPKALFLSGFTQK